MRGCIRPTLICFAYAAIWLSLAFYPAGQAKIFNRNVLTKAVLVEDVLLEPAPELDSYRGVPGYRGRSGWHKALLTEGTDRNGSSCQIYAFHTSAIIPKGSRFEFGPTEFTHVPKFTALLWKSRAIGKSDGIDPAIIEVKCESYNGSILRTNRYFERSEDICLRNRLTSWLANELNVPDVQICESSLRSSMDYVLRNHERDDGSLESKLVKLLLKYVRPDFDTDYINELVGTDSPIAFH